MAKPTILGDALRAELKEMIREVLREEQAENASTPSTEKDALLTAEEAAKLMGVTPRCAARGSNLDANAFGEKFC